MNSNATSGFIQRASDIFRTPGWGFIHIDNAELDHESISHLIEYTQKILESEKNCSVTKIFDEKEGICLSAGIDDSVMLYSVLRYFAQDLFILDGYPKIKRLDGGSKFRGR